MKQSRLTTSGYELVNKCTLKRIFIDEMSLVIPWTDMVDLIQPFVPAGTGSKGGRPSFAIETILRFRHLLEEQILSIQLLAKNTAQLMLFALSNVWIDRRHLLEPISNVPTVEAEEN